MLTATTTFAAPDPQPSAPSRGAAAACTIAAALPRPGDAPAVVRARRRLEDLAVRLAAGADVADAVERAERDHASALRDAFVEASSPWAAALDEAAAAVANSVARQRALEGAFWLLGVGAGSPVEVVELLVPFAWLRSGDRAGFTPEAAAFLIGRGVARRPA